MSIFRVRTGQSGSASGSLFWDSVDPRLAPTPDYGTLGPDSDFAKNLGELPVPSVASTPPNRSATPCAAANVRLLSVLAMGLGILAALAGAVSGSSHVFIKKFQGSISNREGSTSAGNARDLNRGNAQEQAETLLTRAVSHSEGATDEIQSRIDSWRGQLNLDPQLSQLTTAALNSDAPAVRASGVEVQLVAYGLDKRVATVERLLHGADSSDHAQKIWALWALGLLGNRGVESDQIVQALTAHIEGATKDPDEDSRRWAVEALALVGTNATITPLLRVMHDDASPLVRERAACSLAESGMLTHAQRMTAVPQLIDYSDDPSLDAQTHAWVFQALSDITGKRLPRDPGAWRNWYQTSAGRN
jgi:HEAT repeats